MFVQNLEHINQFVIYDDERNIYYFQSYRSEIAKFEVSTKTLTLYSKWDYSITTLKHLYIFINTYTNLWINNDKCKKRQIEDLIKKGIIKEVK